MYVFGRMSGGREVSLGIVIGVSVEFVEVFVEAEKGGGRVDRVVC